MPEPTQRSDDPPEGRAPALRALRAVVGEAARRLEALRERTRTLEAENERLRERVAELKASPGAGYDGAAVFLDEDPDALRAQIDDFIELINAELE